jgi:two-component system, NarL family, nitrate/nitrite response regulator NarL
MQTEIRVLLVNQIALLCDVMAAVLQEEPDMEVIGQATTLGEALDLAPQADVILVNTSMEDGVALALTRAVVDSALPSKVLALGLTESREQVLEYVQAGAAGYVLNDDSVEDLLERIRGVHAGQVQVSPRIAAALISRISEYAQLLRQVRRETGGTDSLTPREQEILALIPQGLTNQQIAGRLSIEMGTVKNHVHNILRKLDASNRHEAATCWSIDREGTDVVRAVPGLLQGAPRLDGSIHSVRNSSSPEGPALAGPSGWRAEEASRARAGPLAKPQVFNGLIGSRYGDGR